MKWNIEWVDLQNIERMVAECWRISERQQQNYYHKLQSQKELVFAGRLGLKYLDIMDGLIYGHAKYGWSELQKDVHMLQEIIQEGAKEDDFYWQRKYRELEGEPDKYFYTELGQEFLAQLADNLELNVPAEQKMLNRDIQKIQELCSVCDWGNETDAEKALNFLSRKDKVLFASWLGDCFIEVIQRRYGKKEGPLPELPPVKKSRKELRREQKKAAREAKAERKLKSRRTPIARKLACTFFICISISCLGYWLYTQVQRNEGIWKMHQLKSSVDEILGIDPGNEGENEDDRSPEKDNGQAMGSDAGQQEMTVARHRSDSPAPTFPQKTAGILDQNVADTGTENEKEPEKEEKEEIPEILPQYQAFHKEYPDLFGWLEIPDTEIDHPVMQSDDETSDERYFYLHHDYAGNQTEEGSLFVDSQSNCYPQDNNTVIYGHNMKNGHNFGMLEQYADKGFCQEHQTIQYDTLYETGTYRVIAVLKSRILYQEEEGFRYYQLFNYGSQNEFQECLDFITGNMLFDLGETLRYGDKLLMLSTCEYSQENGRLVVVAKKIENE